MRRRYQKRLPTRVALEGGNVDVRCRANGGDRAPVRPIVFFLKGDDLASPSARTSNDPQVRAAALSYFPGRSGDIIIIPKENWLLAASVTTHGTLYSYDQRVPVLFYGAGIRSGVYSDPATPADVAATLASIVGVRLPSPDGQVLKNALR